MSGLSIDILKMQSWTHVGRTANIIIKDVIHVFASISKIMRILLMGRRNREHWHVIIIHAIISLTMLVKEGSPLQYEDLTGSHSSLMEKIVFDILIYLYKIVQDDVISTV